MAKSDRKDRDGRSDHYYRQSRRDPDDNGRHSESRKSSSRAEYLGTIHGIGHRHKVIIPMYLFSDFKSDRRSHEKVSRLVEYEDDNDTSEEEQMAMMESKSHRHRYNKSESSGNRESSGRHKAKSSHKEAKRSKTRHSPRMVTPSPPPERQQSKHKTSSRASRFALLIKFL